MQIGQCFLLHPGRQRWEGRGLINNGVTYLGDLVAEYDDGLPRPVSRSQGVGRQGGSLYRTVYCLAVPVVFCLYDIPIFLAEASICSS